MWKKILLILCLSLFLGCTTNKNRTKVQYEDSNTKQEEHYGESQEEESQEEESPEEESPWSNEDSAEYGY